MSVLIGAYHHDDRTKCVCGGQGANFNSQRKSLSPGNWCKGLPKHTDNYDDLPWIEKKIGRLRGQSVSFDLDVGGRGEDGRDGGQGGGKRERGYGEEDMN